MTRVMFILLVCWSVNAATYYVDSVAGNDSNPGTQAQPFQTVSKVQGSNGVGATILLKSGSVFRESFEVPTNSLVWLYGGLTKPLVSGAVVLTNAQFSLAPLCTNTYQYAITVPNETNSYANIVHSNVLMVWENNVRMGARWDKNLGFGATNKVDANAGSFWYDTNAHILYIHPADNGNPVSNGKTYEASIRTLAFHGGDSFTVQDINAEKAYAFNSVGQQGYQMLGYAGGTYRRGRAWYSWNHCFGVANEVLAGLLTFDSIWGSDCENQSDNVPTIAVAYKNGASPCSVLFTNCLVTQPTLNTDIHMTGFYAHDASTGTKIVPSWVGCVVQNTYWGFQTASSTVGTFNNNVDVGCYNGLGSWWPTMTCLSNYSSYYAGNDGLYHVAPGISLMGCKVVGAVGQGASIINSTGIGVTNCVFASTNNAAPAPVLIGGFATANAITCFSNSFYGAWNQYNSIGIVASDYNNFYGWGNRLGSDCNPQGTATTFANWQKTGVDTHSTNIDPAYPASFFTYTVTDPTIYLGTVGTVTTMRANTLRTGQ